MKDSIPLSNVPRLHEKIGLWTASNTPSLDENQMRSELIAAYRSVGASLEGQSDQFEDVAQGRGELDDDTKQALIMDEAMIAQAVNTSQSPAVAKAACQAERRYGVEAQQRQARNEVLLMAASFGPFAVVRLARMSLWLGRAASVSIRGQRLGYLAMRSSQVLLGGANMANVYRDIASACFSGDTRATVATSGSNNQCTSSPSLEMLPESQCLTEAAITAGLAAVGGYGIIRANQFSPSLRRLALPPPGANGPVTEMLDDGVQIVYWPGRMHTEIAVDGRLYDRSVKGALNRKNRNNRTLEAARRRAADGGPGIIAFHMRVSQAELDDIRRFVDTNRSRSLSCNAAACRVLNENTDMTIPQPIAQFPMGNSVYMGIRRLLQGSEGRIARIEYHVDARDVASAALWSGVEAVHMVHAGVWAGGYVTVSVMTANGVEDYLFPIEVSQ